MCTLYIQVQLLSKAEELESMMVQLNKYQPLLSLPCFVPGNVCSANSSIDKRWYRAVITEVHPGPSGIDSASTVSFFQFLCSRRSNLMLGSGMP